MLFFCTMIGFWRSVFILYLLVWKVGALNEKYDWTFGKRKTNIAYSKPSTDSLAVDGNFETFTQISGEGPQWWKVDLGAVYTVAMIRLYPEAPAEAIHQVSSVETVAIWLAEVQTSQPLTRYSDDWIKIKYDKVVYGYGMTADFQPPASVIHVGITTTKNILKIAELQVFAPMNLARQGDIQASNSGEFNALTLVNGIYEDSLHITTDGKKWIDVDLWEIYSIRLIEVFKCSDQEAKILTAKDYPVKTLFESEDEWIPRTHPRIGPAGKLRFMFSTTVLEARRVALVSYKSTSSLTVAELVIHEYNYALGREARVKLTSDITQIFRNYSVRNLIDGDLNTFLSTSKDINATWTLEFGKRIFFQRALIYVGSVNSALQYSSRLFNAKKIFAMTTGGEELCLHVTNFIGDSFILECNTNVSQGLRIVSTDTATELREIVVHGKELPTMADAEFEAKRVDRTTVSLTFKQWTSKSPGFKPPDKYVLRNVGSGTLEKTEFVHDDGGPIQTNIIGLRRNDLIAVYAECQIDGEKCAGQPAEVYSFSQYERSSSVFTTALMAATAVFFGLAAIGTVLVFWKKLEEQSKVSIQLPTIEDTEHQKVQAQLKITRTPEMSRFLGVKETINFLKTPSIERSISIMKDRMEEAFKKAVDSSRQALTTTRPTSSKTETKQKFKTVNPSEDEISSRKH